MQMLRIMDTSRRQGPQKCGPHPARIRRRGHTYLWPEWVGIVGWWGEWVGCYCRLNRLTDQNRKSKLPQDEANAMAMAVSVTSPNIPLKLYEMQALKEDIPVLQKGPLWVGSKSFLNHLCKRTSACGKPFFKYATNFSPCLTAATIATWLATFLFWPTALGPVQWKQYKL